MVASRAKKYNSPEQPVQDSCNWRTNASRSHFSEEDERVPQEACAEYYTALYRLPDSGAASPALRENSVVYSFENSLEEKSLSHPKKEGVSSSDGRSFEPPFLVSILFLIVSITLALEDLLLRQRQKK